MSISIAAAARLGREWILSQTHLPQGVVLEVREYLENDIWLCHAVLPVEFSQSGDEQRYRVNTLFVAEEGVDARSDRTDHVLNDLIGQAEYEPLCETGRVEVYLQYEPFSRGNRPDNLEDVKVWLEAFLLPKKESLDDQLELTKESDFETEGGYWEWRERAREALRFTSKEIAYLRGYIASQSARADEEGSLAKVKGPAPGVKTPRVLALLADYSRQAQEKAAEIAERYTQMYSTDNLPPNTDAALGRKALLEELFADAERFHNRVMTEGVAAGAPRKTLRRTRAPVVDVDQLVRVELEVVTAYLQQSLTSPVTILLRIIDRVVAEGFELTEQEGEDLVRITAIHNTSP